MLALDGLFQRVDALIGPFMTGPMLVASNFTGHPCLHLRAGFLETRQRAALASLGAGKLTTGEPDPAGPLFRVPQGISLWGRLFEEGAAAQPRHGAGARARRRGRTPEFRCLTQPHQRSPVMNRREFLASTTLLGGVAAIGGAPSLRQWRKPRPRKAAR